MKAFKKIMALLLTYTLVVGILPTSALAAVDPGMSINGVKPGTGSMKQMAYALTITRVRADGEGWKDFDGKDGITVTDAVNQRYLTQFPTDVITDPEFINNSTWILSGISTNSQILSTSNYYVRDSSQAVPIITSNIREAQKSYNPGKIMGFAYNELAAEFKKNNGTMTWAQYEAIVKNLFGQWVDQNKGVTTKTDLWKGASSFYSVFAEKNDYAADITEYLDSGISGLEKDDALAIRYLDLLTIIALFSQRSGGSYAYVLSEYKSMIEPYLQDWNCPAVKEGDTTAQYTVAAVFPIAVGPSGGGSMWWYTWPSYYSKKFGAGIESLLSYEPRIYSGASYKSNQNAFQSEDFKALSVQTNGLSNSAWPWRNDTIWANYSIDNYGRYSAVSSKNNYNYRYAAYMLDASGQPTAGTGYTFFARNTNMKPAPSASDFHIWLDAVEKRAEMKQAGDVTSVKVTVNVAAGKEKITDEAMAQMEALFKQQKGVSVLIELWGAPKSDIDPNFPSNVVNSTIIDSINLLPSVWVKTGSGGFYQFKATFGEGQWNEFKELMSGNRSIVFTDGNITVNSNTIMKYAARSQLVWNGDAANKYMRWAVAVGREIDYSTGTPPTMSQDFVRRIVPPKVEVIKYYSAPEEPYVEIKEGRPGGESFEAMAGVPTTEDLYLGFGATEFIANVEHERKTQSDAKRTWTLTATISDCWGANVKCAISCPGHFAGCPGYPGPPDKDGNPTTSYCGGASCGAGGKASCPHGASVACPNNGKGMCSWNTGAAGCVHSPVQNSAHPSTHQNTYTTTNPINEFAYLDITNAELWQLNRLNLKSYPELLYTPDVTIDPKTGYKSFFTQDKYTANNGRLLYSFNLKDSEKWGDTTIAQSFTCGKQCNNAAASDPGDIAATAWANAQTSGSFVTTAISDYLVMTTSEGFQPESFYQYKSNSTKIRAADFQNTAHGGSVSATGTTVTWPKVPTKEELWDNNATSAAKWEIDHITRSGYNGNFSQPLSKWNNTNVTLATDPLTVVPELVSQPNTQVKAGSLTFNKNMNNLRLTKLGLDIVDSTDADRDWSNSDGVKPVSNGEWNTGNCWIEYDKEINFKNPQAEDWSNFGPGNTIYKKDVTYSSAHDKVNNIVIHNPVSVKYSVVLTNDKKYDLRTADSLAQGGDPVKDEAGCPGNESCIYSKLSCTAAHKLHLASCYQNVQTGYHHVGGLNSHEHTDSCGTQVPLNWAYGAQFRHCYNGCEDLYATYPSTTTTAGFVVVVNSTQSDILAKLGYTLYIERYGEYWYTYTAALVNSLAFSGTITGGSATKEFAYNGTYQLFTAPKTGDYKLEVWGAEGGTSGKGGKGGYSEGTVHLVAGQLLYVYVGSNGGYNGGGASKSSTYCGGGATDIRLDSTATNARIIVAGGGGGWGGIGSGAGGAGGGLTGGNGLMGYSSRNPGLGGSQSAGGAGGIGSSYGASGGLGYGGNQPYGSSSGGGGGGGGYFGGGAGGVDYPAYNDLDDGDGGGGSGYIGGVTGGSMQSGVQSGNGKAIISSSTPACDNKPNVHVCTPGCGADYEKVLVCQDPHHYKPGEPHDPNSPLSHYAFPDSRCYISCKDDAKHKEPGTITLPGGTPASASDVFINLDREFKVFASSVGDFAMNPGLHGISQCTSTNGMGYTDGMDTEKWIREKYVRFPVNVIDSNGVARRAGEEINLLELPDVNKEYTFYSVLANSELMNAETSFTSIANNAREVEFYSENDSTTNIQRGAHYAAKHTANKIQLIDVVGYIGSLTLNDTGDFRFANLFKKSVAGGGWLIENLVPRVDYKIPNVVLSDKLDIRQEVADATTKWHATYGNTTFNTGGKSFPYVSLPLTPAKNNIEALRNQPMRPGYQLYGDIETVGNYYGSTYDEEGIPLDTNMVLKTQMTPKYWSLDLTTKKYTPVDVYMNVNNNWAPVVKFNEQDKGYEYVYYLDWFEESMRRNYSVNEQKASQDVKTTFSDDLLTIRLPITIPDPVGSANRLFLNDLNRTFIGSSKTYGVSKNPGNTWGEAYFEKQSQRWHWTLGLPSSAVFVEAGKPCTDANIKSMYQTSAGTVKNCVIVCAVDILSRGEVWTLEYDGTSVNTSDGGGFKVIPGGPVYPPKDAYGEGPGSMPIINVYHPNRTAQDDLRTEGIS